MRKMKRRSLGLALLVVGFASWGAFALPSFSDRDIAAGNLNPTDTIRVQEIRVTRSAGEEITLSTVTIRNLGTAGDGDIAKITVMDGGVELGSTENLSGIKTTNGITIPISYYLDDTTHYIKILVTVGPTVDGGETVELQCLFDYTREGLPGTSAWISDLTAETIRNGGFDQIEDSSPDAAFLNAEDTAVVQIAVFTDNDANGMPVAWAGLTDTKIVLIENIGTALPTNDVVRVKVTLTVAGTDYVWDSDGDKLNGIDEWGTWDPASPMAFEYWHFWDGPIGDVTLTNNPPEVPDNGGVTVKVEMEVAGAGTVTDGRTIRTRTTLLVEEEGQDSGEPAVRYDQEITAATTQTIRKQGFETIEDDSESLTSGTAATNDDVIQTVRAYDIDSNDKDVEVFEFYLRNMGSAGGDEIAQVLVQAGAQTILTLDTGDLNNFKTGEWHALTPVTPLVVDDDDDQIFRITYTIGTPDDGHTLKPAVRFRVREEPTTGPQFDSDEVVYPDTLELYEPGFEFVENVTPPAGGAAYSGQRLLAQTIRLEDRDEDDEDVTIDPVIVRNAGTASGNPDVTKIEIWRRDTEEGEPLKLGEETDLSGFRTGGVRVDIENDSVVQDGAEGSEIFLDIYLQLAEPEDVTAGRTIQLDTRVIHTENRATFDKEAASNQWVLEINHRPVPDFTYELANNAPASIGPMADFTYEDTIQFTGEATDSDGDEIVAWHWDFGDGNTSDEQNPTHRYPNGGTFEVTLTVTDERGITGSVTKTIEVEGPPNEPPTIEEITADPENPAEDQDVQFGAVVSDPDQPAATAFTYAWDFGDETTSATAAPVHSYAEDGSYTVTLTVTDAQDGTDTATIEIIVGNDPPTLTGVTANPTDAQTGDDVTFTAQGAADPDGDDIVEYRWDFGDGTTATTSGNTATHVYAVAGTYTASVRAVDEREAVSDPETVEVTAEGPTQLITYAYPNPASTSATVSYLLPEDAVDPVLRIYSVSGLLIREEELAAGETTYAWDLNDDRGNQMPNGLYFCIVTAEDGDGGALSSEIFRLLIVR